MGETVDIEHTVLAALPENVLDLIQNIYPDGFGIIA